MHALIVRVPLLLTTRSPVGHARQIPISAMVVVVMRAQPLQLMAEVEVCLYSDERKKHDSQR